MSAFYDQQMAGVVTTTNVLSRGQVMKKGDMLKSPDGGYELRMQPDGNLVLYHPGQSQGAVWSTDTWKPPVPGDYAILQGQDGNFVIYASDKKTAVWATGTWQPTANQGDRLTLYDNGDLILRNAVGNVVWHR
jgi:hypothetical protein